MKISLYKKSLYIVWGEELFTPPTKNRSPLRVNNRSPLRSLYHRCYQYVNLDSLSDRKIAKNRINVLKTDEKNAPNRYLVHSGIEKQLKHTGSSPCRSDRDTPCPAPCNCIISALYVFVKGARKRTCSPLTNAYSVLFCCRGAGHAQAKGE